MDNNIPNSNNNNNNQNNNNNNGNKGKNGRSIVVLLVISILLTFLFWRVFDRLSTGREETVTYGEFIQMLDAGEIKKVKIYSSEVSFETNQDEKIVSKVTYTATRISDSELAEKLRQAKIKYGTEYEGVDESGSAFAGTIISYIVMIVAFYLLLTMIMKRSGGVGKANAKIYLEIGATLPKGALLVGPPGTGKTLLAKAVAGEANVPFFSMSGSSFVEMYVGVGASRVRDLFKQATQMAPCIIFIDEIDAIGRSRDSRHGGDSEREQTLNQLLAEMDGFDTSKGIVILAATNRPEVLDKALLRPGRFDRRVIVEKPDLKGRIDTLKVHSKNVKMDETVDLRELALATSGAVGADLANIINEGALAAVRDGRNLVSQKDLIGAVEVVFAGKEKKDRLLSKKEKQIVAYHEVGHALLAALQKHTEPIQRITIVPRTMGSLGYVWQVPEEEKYLESKNELEAELVTLLAGRAAEELKFDSITTGAANDIEKATKTARAMITMYGMSDKFGMVQLESIEGQYLDRSMALQCSDETATKIDKEIRDMLRDAYNRAKKILSAHMAALDSIASFLIEHETITGKEFMSILAQVEPQK